MEIKKDCFAYTRKECGALTTIDCTDCSFYKTKEQAEEERERANTRIEHLDDKKKKHILSKYHNKH